MLFLDYIKERKMLILVISIISNIIFIISILVLIYLYFNKECTCEVKDFEVKEKEEIICDSSSEDESFFVEIKGEVKNPGVYEVNNNNIINDVISLAGGLNESAYTDNINLSKKVSKELVVFIYNKDDFKKSTNKKVENTCICPSYDISICTEEKKSEILPDDSNVNNEEVNNAKEESVDSPNIDVNNNTLDLNKKININLATKSELTKLSGIGDAKADKIIAYREQNGGFKSIEEIKKVSGIGDAIYEKIKDYITI